MLNKLFKFFSQSAKFYSKIWVYAFAHIKAYTLCENILTLESQIRYKNKVFTSLTAVNISIFLLLDYREASSFIFKLIGKVRGIQPYKVSLV